MNSDIIIRAENLGKRYQLGQSVDLTRNFREALAAFPRKLARLARHKTQHALDAVRTRADAATQPPYDPETPPGTFWALRDVSFEIKRGEVVGIIGRNGAGKSTLLKILSRITSPTHGHAEIHGRLASLLEVGTGFHPELTGRENIYLNGAILGMHKAEIARKFDEIVAFAEVEKFLDTPVKRYSSGMYVRLAFAVAAHLESEVLIVDEVLAVGDAAFQKKCLGRLNEVAMGGRTVLFVSHNMAAIHALCQRAIILKAGQIQFSGHVDAAMHYYADEQLTTKPSLAERMDRQGNGKVRVTNLRIFNQDEREAQTIPMGEKFSIELCTNGYLKSAIVGILIGNSMQKQLTRAYSWEQLATGIDLQNQSCIRVTFEQCPLMHGIYEIHTWIGMPNEVADYLENASLLTIEPRDVFNTGHIPDAHGGVAYSRCKWEIK